MEALLDKNRRLPNHKNRVDARIEKRVCEMAIENPALGHARVSSKLRKEGLCILPGVVGSVWLRHELQGCKLRLKASEAKLAQAGGVFSEAQLAIL